MIQCTGMAAKHLMRIWHKTATSSVLALLVSTPTNASANWLEEAFTGTKNNGGCGTMDFTCNPNVKKGVKAIKEGLADFDASVIQPIGNAIKEGVDSAAKVCRKVGLSTCMNPNFQQTYVTIKLSANAGLIRDADSCGAMVQSAVNGGAKAVQMYATAKGVPLPNEVIAIGASSYQQYGIGSCEVVFGRAPNLSGYTQTAEGAVVTPDSLPRITGQVVAGPSVHNPNSAEAQLALLKEQQKIEQERREQQARQDQERRAQEERDRREREESERRLQEIKQKNELNATLINAGSNLLGAIISRIGRRSEQREDIQSSAQTQATSNVQTVPIHQPIFIPPNGYVPQQGYLTQPAYPQQGGYIQQPGYYPPSGYAQQPGYVQQPSFGHQPGYHQQPVNAAHPPYPQQPSYTQQPGYVQASTQAPATIQAAMLQSRPLGGNSEIETKLGLIIDPACSLSSLIIRLINSQTVCAYPKPPYAPGRYFFNGTSLVVAK